MSRARPFAKRLLFRTLAVALGVLLAVAVAETAFRLLHPGYRLHTRFERELFCEFDARLGWAPKRDFAGVHEGPGFSVEVRQNRLGLRAPDDLDARKPPGKRRVLVLGDSTVWGFGVEDDEVFTHPDVHGRADLELVNCGVSGYGTDQELLFLQSLGLEADAVVLVVTPRNDFANNVSSRAYGYRKPYFALEDGGLRLHAEHVRPSRLQQLVNAVRRVRVINYLGTRILRAREQARSRERQGAPRGAPDDGREAVELTARILEEMERRVEAKGMDFTVVLLPFRSHVRRGVEGNHPLARALAARLETLGVHCVEPYPLFLDAAAGGAALFSDEHEHLSPAGHALFARVVADAARHEPERR